MASVIRSFIVCYIIYREDDYLLDGCQQIAIITGSVQQCDCPGEDRVGECGSSILNYLLAYILKQAVCQLKTMPNKAGFAEFSMQRGIFA